MPINNPQTISPAYGKVLVPQSQTITLANIPANASAAFTIDLARYCFIHSLQTDRPARVRLYTSHDRRSQDEARGLDVAALPGNGLLLETIFTAQQLAIELSPSVWCVGENNQRRFYGLLHNNSDQVRSISLDIKYLVPNDLLNINSTVIAPIASYSTEFSQSNLSVLGWLAVVHNLGANVSSVVITDEFNEVIYADSIDIADENSIAINLESFVPIDGIWRVSIGI